MRDALVAVGCLLLVGACAHHPPKPDPDAVKQAAELFHQRTRWKDFKGAAGLVVPERRHAFEEGRRVLNDERDLTISDYQIEELNLDPDGKTAHVTSTVSWVRLPSVSEHTEEVHTDLVQQGGAWLVARQDAGPFADELSAPLTP